MIELVGIISSIIIIFSMSFSSANPRNNIIMRIINTVGSIGFCVYGLLLPAYSTFILNFAAIILNITHIISLIKKYKNT